MNTNSGILAKLRKGFHNPRLFLLPVLNAFASGLSDEMFVKWKYFVYMGRFPDLKNPKTFSEKLQWLKLYDRKPEYTTMVDKYAVKKYVADLIGEEYIIPTLGVWDKPEDIDFDSLPNQFVLKTTHGGGGTGVVICKDKQTFDRNAAISILNRSLRSDLYLSNREWPYKNVPRRIIAEQYLEDNTCQYLRDFKFYTFNGEPKCFYITSDKGLGLPTKQDFFDCFGNQMDMQDVNYPAQKKSSKPKLPTKLSAMVELSRILSKNTHHLRVDLYEINGRIYVGELTFYEGAGFCSFTPDKYNRILGDWIHLPSNK